MNERTKGAWIFHHQSKLRELEEHDFDNIEAAGNTGKFLSGLVASDEESRLAPEKVKIIAKGAGVSKDALPVVLERLKTRHLIDISTTGEVVALGLTTGSVLEHTAGMFSDLEPTVKEKASLLLAEEISAEPVKESLMRELIADSFQVKKAEAGEIIQQSQVAGLIDSEQVEDQVLLFNGNLFKTDNLQRMAKVLDSLSATDRAALVSINQEITQTGCITFEKAEKIAGRVLLEKVQSVGMYDFSKVSNPHDSKLFVTRPSAFAKYGRPFEEDALDYAKALVASLSYGINYSHPMRGRIDWLPWLLRALMEGREVGPADAIGQDYRYLEEKHVVAVRKEGFKFYMRLLKKEVGELACQVMQRGDASETSLMQSGVNMTGYQGPEKTRQQTRRKRTIKKSDAEVASMLRVMREKN
jgi:DNA-binding transcriptional ArsR family regulator